MEPARSWDPSLVRRVRRELLKAAKERRTVTYGRLMRKFHLSRGHSSGRGVSGMIGAVDEAEYARGAPGFAAIVVRKDTSLPGGGYFCDISLSPRLRRSRGRATDPRLSSEEKAHILAQRKRIWQYYGSSG